MEQDASFRTGELELFQARADQRASVPDDAAGKGPELMYVHENPHPPHSLVCNYYIR